MKEKHCLRPHHSLLIAIIAGFASGPVNADIFVNIPGIPGDSLDANHADWIDAFATGGNFTTNSCGEFVVKKEIDRAFPLLVASVVSGQVFSTIVVETTADIFGSRATFSTITLNGAVITSLSTQTIGDDTGVPVEQLTIQASSIKVEYIDYDSTGNSQGTITETVICGKPKHK